MGRLTYTVWSDRFGDWVSRMREAETGIVTLTHNSEFDDDVLYRWFVEGVKPKEAARRFLAGL